MSNLLKRLKKEGNPIVLEDDEVLFVWHGKKAPYLHLETEQFQPVTMQRIKKNLWTYQAEFHPEAYVEYYFSKKKKKRDKIILDPYNTRTVPTGVDSKNNFFSMPRRIHTPMTMKRRGIVKGKVTKHKITDASFLQGKKRKVWLYHPPTTEAVPLLVVLDGNDYRKRAHITRIVDNMIADERIKPIAMVMIKNAGDYRMIEYNQGDSIPLLLDRAVLPLAQKEFKLLDTDAYPGAYGLVGASQGGLIALYTALRMPDIFGKVISQSGAFFSFDDGRRTMIQIMVDDFPRADVQVWMDIGIYDFLFEANQDMRQRLGTKGYDVTYAEHFGGHNWTSWRDMLPAALETMFGV